MPLTLEKKIVAGFSAAVGFMLVIGGAAWWSAVRSVGTFQQVDHTYRVLDQLEAGLTDMLNMQTATRGYLLTGDQRFLEPYKLGSARIEQSLRTLRSLTADNPGRRNTWAAWKPTWPVPPPSCASSSPGAKPRIPPTG